MTGRPKGLFVAGAVYVVVTAFLFLNLLPDLATRLYSDIGDPMLNAAILGWNARVVPLTTAWWNFPSFAPLQGVTSFTEHLLAAYPVTTPVIWATGNPVLAHNVAFLLAPPLNGLATCALAREVTGSHLAAFVAGLAFAFAPYQSVHLSHLQMMMAFGMPLGLLGLHRWLTSGDRRSLLLFGAGWLITGLSNAYVLLFFPLLVALWCAWFVRPREWRRLVPPAIAALVASLPLIPLLWGYHVRQAEYGFAREYNEIRSFSADMAGLIGMYHRAVPWRGLLPHDYEEGALFPGFTIAALAIVAVLGGSASPDANARRNPPHVPHPNAAAALGAPRRPGAAAHWIRRRGPGARLLVASGILSLVVLARVWTGPFGWHIGPLPLPPFFPYQLFTVAFVLCIAGLVLTATFRQSWARRDAVMFYGVATAVMWLFALGPEPAWSTPWRALWSGPYRLLMELPGVNGVRVPARAWMPAALGLAILVGFGTLAVINRFPRYRRTIVFALASLVVVEGWFADGTAEVPGLTLERAIPRGALALDLPMDEGYWNALPQYRGVLLGYRTINGFSGYEPPHFRPLRHGIAELSPTALDAYRRVEDLYVILRPGEQPLVVQWVSNLPGAQHLFSEDGNMLYRLPRFR